MRRDTGRPTCRDTNGTSRFMARESGHSNGMRKLSTLGTWAQCKRKHTSCGIGLQAPAVFLVHEVYHPDPSVLGEALRQGSRALLVHAILLEVDVLYHRVHAELRHDQDTNQNIGAWFP